LLQVPKAVETLDLALDATIPLQQCLFDLSPNFSMLLSEYSVGESGTLDGYVADLAVSVEKRIAEHVASTDELERKIAVAVAKLATDQKKSGNSCIQKIAIATSNTATSSSSSIGTTASAVKAATARGPRK
jgi:hypothetical protein